MTVFQDVKNVSIGLSALNRELADIVANWSGDVGTPTPTPTPVPVPVPGVEPDPRSARVRAFSNASGKIDGMALTYWPMKDTRFQLVDYDFFTEDESKNSTNTIVHVYKWAKVGGRDVLVPARARCYLAWPIDSTGNPQSLESWQVPGNVSEPYDHVTQSTFLPPKKGPLAIFIGDDHGNIDSDVAGGIGLPNNRHVCFHLVYVERVK